MGGGKHQRQKSADLLAEHQLAGRASPGTPAESADAAPAVLAVSQALLDLIDANYPGTLRRIAGEFHWRLNNGSIVRLKASGATGRG